MVNNDEWSITIKAQASSVGMDRLVLHRVSRLLLVLLVALAGLVPLPTAQATATIIYVIPGGTGSGTSWGDGVDLAAALEAASSGSELWVAAGVYRPSVQRDPANPRTATFQLKDGVAIYGGFGGDETSRTARDWLANRVTLSGELGTPGDTSDNSYNVVTGARNAILDGVTISGGNANLPQRPSFAGGGMYNPPQADPLLRNLILSENNAIHGGGMYNQQSNPRLFNVAFTDNSAVQGGGMYNNEGANPTLRNVRFSGNRAGRGGGMHNDEASSPTLFNVSFSGNYADFFGGGMSNNNSDPRLINVSISGNQANSAGGGIHNRRASMLLMANSIIWGNRAPSGAAIANEDTATATISFSLLEASGGSGLAWNSLLGVDAGSNLDIDPRFVTPVSGELPNRSGDLRLQAASPAINVASNALLPAAEPTFVTADDSAELLLRDLGGNPRQIGGTVDMGAYEAWPAVLAISRTDPSPTSAASVSFSVSFNMAVSGVEASTFVLATTGDQAGATISALSGSGTRWQVTVATVAEADGTLGLNLVDSDTILSADLLPVPLGGFGLGNGDFSGALYVVERALPASEPAYLIFMPLVVRKREHSR